MSFGGPKKGGWGSANPKLQIKYVKEAPKPKPEPKVELKNTSEDEELPSPIVSDTTQGGKRTILLEGNCLFCKILENISISGTLLKRLLRVL
jgi:hypothetical protein